MLLAGCLKPRPAWRELQFTRTKPPEVDLVGTWRPTAETVKDIRDNGHYPAATHEMVLRADHTFTMRNMPDWWRNCFGQSHGQMESGDGTWDLVPAKIVWQIWIVRLRFSVPSFETTVHLYGQRSPYLIFIRVGDPDVGDAMFFERPKA
jgi:hypothetical protein